MNKIKELREQNNETQEELGKILNVSKATISKYENGSVEVSNEALIKLANHFGVTTDYLLGRTDEPNDIEKNDLKMAASTDIDLAKLAEIDPSKKKAITDNINAMINMFYEEFGKKED